MVKKQGDHLKPNDTKSYIIEYILGNIGPVGEPTIRDHLKAKFDLGDQGTINRHLHYLKNNGCIGLIKPEKEGWRNKWDITKTEHLINIRNKFSDIQLNKNEKSLMIVHKKCGYDFFTFAGLFHYVKLLLSVSFFNACLGTSINILSERVWEIYRIKNRVDFLDMDESMKCIYDDYITLHPMLKIPGESFLSMIDQMSQLEPEDSTETFMKIWEKELLGVSKETLAEMHLETMDDDLEIYKNIRDIASKLLYHKSIFKATLFDLLFESYLSQDILAGVASLEEIEFFKSTEGYHERHLRDAEDTSNYIDYINNVELMYQNDLIEIFTILTKYKHPSTLSINYNDYVDIVKDIMKILDQQHQFPGRSDKSRVSVEYLKQFKKCISELYNPDAPLRITLNSKGNKMSHCSMLQLE